MIGYGNNLGVYILNPYIYGAGTSYLLDTYSAAAAYSLRQLKTGVTSVVRVRRSSDSAESDFTATEITDGTLTTWVGAGNDGFVVTWYNQASGITNMTQATAADQPQLVSSGSVITKGSLPAVDFVSSDKMAVTSTVLDDANLPISIFSVSSADATETVGVIISSGNIAFRQFCDSRTTPNRNLGCNSALADMSTARVDTNQRLLSSFIDSSYNMSAFDNGATGGTATGSAWSSTTMQLGVQGGATYLDGKIQEVIVFNTDESANRTDIESDINTHYSIY